MAPSLFPSLFANMWEVVGVTAIIPKSWCMGIMVPLLKKGANHEPSNYRPLCMLSHVRKILEIAVVEELYSLVRPDRIQFGFQSHINTLQAAMDIAAKLNELVQKIIAVLDLTKAYNRVVRAMLIEKLEKMGIPQDLVTQIVVFLVPLIVQTAGDVTKLTVTLTTDLAEGGTASPPLFRIFIDDLERPLRQAQGKETEASGDSLDDPCKLVADDVILIGKSETEMHKLLDTCIEWDELKN